LYIKTQSAKALSITNEIAIHIEKYGYDEQEITNLKDYDYFDQVVINTIKDHSNIRTFLITTTKKYKSFSNFYDFMNKDIVCKLNVSIKES